MDIDDVVIHVPDYDKMKKRKLTDDEKKAAIKRFEEEINGPNISIEDILKIATGIAKLML